MPTNVNNPAKKPQKKTQPPLAEHAVDDPIGPKQREDVPMPTDVPTLVSRNRPEKERANQLSCLQEVPEIIHRRVSSAHLCRIGWQFVIYFCLHRGSLPENTAGRQPRLGAKNPRRKNFVRNYMSAKIDNGWLHG